jgi:doublecortin-like kinase 3
VSQGKEHMIESEIAILSSVSHPNIIELEEVFDFPTEKYLIMEYVQVVFAVLRLKMKFFYRMKVCFIFYKCAALIISYSFLILKRFLLRCQGK